MKRVRQNPASCQFCRMKKLRCSRGTPCGNCVARDVDCIYGVGSEVIPPTPSTSRSAVGHPRVSLQSLHARVQRIENIISSGKIDGGSISAPDITDFIGKNTYLSPHPTSRLPQEETNQGENERRESIGGVGNTSGMARSGRLSRPPFECTQLLQVWPANPESNFTKSHWKNALPNYEEAIQLLDCYAHDVSWKYHFLHAPTLRRHLQRVYQQLTSGPMPQPADLALLCAVFALAKYFSHPPTMQDDGNGGADESSYNHYVSLTSKALIEARHLDTPSLESIQAVMLLASHLLLNTGVMGAYRVLLSAMFMSAQTLLIHQVDSPKNQRLREDTAYDRIELELQRRLWWHIASSDWVHALISDTQTETYIVHSRRMHVNLPSNTDDAALSHDHCVDEPLSVPTEMTYFLLRCRFSMLYRDMLDSAAERGLGLDEVPYDDILAFDRKVTAQIDAIPYFLKMDPESRARCTLLDQQRPYLVSQRLMAQFGAATRMSRLHRPYIARAVRDPKYAYPRMACLESARTVLETEKWIRSELPHAQRTVDPSKVGAMMCLMTFATLVLVMDYHFNRDGPHAQERLQEVMDCLQRLEAARSVSGAAARGLEELEDVMRKYGLLSSRASGFQDLVKSKSREVEMESGDALGFSWMDSWDFNVELAPNQWTELFQDLGSMPSM